MNSRISNIIKHKIFFYIALGTVLLLMVPLLLMKFKIPFHDPGSGYEVVNWDLGDFILMGVLIFGTGSLFVITARKIKKNNHRIILATSFLLLFLWIWVELAVGVFTNLGN